MGKKFANLTLADLPALAVRIGELKYEEGLDQAEAMDAIQDHVLAIDSLMEDWDFTTKVFLALQKQFDELEETEIRLGWKSDLRRDDFIRLLTQLDQLTPEGEKARAHFGTMSALADQARLYVIVPD